MKDCQSCEYSEVCKNKQLGFNLGDSVRFIDSKAHHKYWQEAHHYLTQVRGKIIDVQSGSYTFACNDTSVYGVHMGDGKTWYLCGCNLQRIQEE